MTASTIATKPSLRRLRPAVHVAPVADGLLFVGWQKSLVLHGSENLLRLWEALFPHLHRGVDVDELLEALPQTARLTARTILAELDDHGFLLRDRAPDPPVTQDAEHSEHPEHLRTRAFLDAAADDPAAAERSLRTTRVAIYGTGEAALSAARSLLRFGVGDVTIADPILRDRLGDLAAEHSAVLRADDRTRSAVAIVVSGTETPGTGRCIGVMELGDHAVVGPFQSHPSTPGVALALRRLRARGDDAPVGPVPTVVARLAGALAALQVVHHVCGISTEYEGMAHLVDAERLTTTTHPVAPEGDALARPLAPTALATPELDALEQLSDERTGLIPPLTPADLPQTPLALVHTADAAGTAVHGWARSGDVARYRAALEAARRSVGPAPRLWDLDSTEPGHHAHVVVSAAGSTFDDLLRDGLQRLVATMLVDEEQTSDRFVTTRAPLTDHGGSGPLRDAWSRWCVRGRPQKLERRTHRLTTSSTPLVTVELIDTASGRTLGMVTAADEDVATAVALDHATAGIDTGPGLGSVPQLAVPPWADSVAEVAPHVERPRQLLEALCRPGEVVVAGQWTAEPGWDRLGLVGWVGIATGHIEGERS